MCYYTLQSISRSVEINVILPSHALITAVNVDTQV